MTWPFSSTCFLPRPKQLLTTKSNFYFGLNATYIIQIRCWSRAFLFRPSSLLLLSFHLYSFPSFPLHLISLFLSFPLLTPPSPPSLSHTPCHAPHIPFPYSSSSLSTFSPFPFPLPFPPPRLFTVNPPFTRFHPNQDHVTLAITPLVILSLHILIFNPSIVEGGTQRGVSTTTSSTALAHSIEVGCYQRASLAILSQFCSNTLVQSSRTHTHPRAEIYSVFLFMLASF